MSFIVKLQTNNSEKHKLSKSITDVTTLEGVLKNETSLIDPIILVKSNIAQIIGINYLTLPNLNRRYFVTDVISKTSTLTEIHCHIDVLTTYAGQIRNHVAILARAEQKGRYNLLLNDGALKSLQKPNYEYVNFTPSETMIGTYVLILSGASEKE